MMPRGRWFLTLSQDTQPGTSGVSCAAFVYVLIIRLLMSFGRRGVHGVSTPYQTRGDRCAAGGPGSRARSVQWSDWTNALRAAVNVAHPSPDRARGGQR